MCPHTETVAPQMTLQEAAQRMRRLHRGVLAVGTAQGLVGMITMRDILFRAVSEGLNPAGTPVAEVMSLGVPYCYKDEEVDHAIGRMEKQRFCYLVVLDRQRHPVGVLTIKDLVARRDGAKLAAEWLNRLHHCADAL